jgi:PEP-CTERM motif-containing protein
MGCATLWQRGDRVSLAGERSRTSQQMAGVARAFFLAAIVVLAPASARAALILDVNPLSISAGPGQVVTFKGRITNTTGATLRATDLFLNFSAFDPAAITDVTQLLGTPDFTLPNNTFSALVDLFQITLAATAPQGRYGIDVALQDVRNNMSNVVHAVAQVGAVPEPSTVMLLLAGAAAVARVRGLVSRRDRRSVPAPVS